jgi:Lrp/AsnC family transcriptional regulator, leucine-responsive regulatory protein
MPEHSPDAVDRAIVTRLQRDGRIANVDLADAIALSPSACLRRVRALEASGIIEGYRAEVSRSRAGLGLTVFIGLKVEGHSQETSSEIERALLAIPRSSPATSSPALTTSSSKPPCRISPVTSSYCSARS